MHTSAYIQWTGHINMSALNLQENDTGGELGALRSERSKSNPTNLLVTCRPARCRPRWEPSWRCAEPSRTTYRFLRITLAGLVYSNQLPGGNNQTEVQAVEWNNFSGSRTSLTSHTRRD